IADVAEVGGKAANLGELLAAGVHVPDGVVLAVGVADMTPGDRESLARDAVSELGSGPFAVRSSGVSEDGVDHSFAGMYESVLSVAADELPAAVERCLASVGTSRAADYLPGTSGRMAVIIQRMITPAAAGVALTADPINGDRHTSVVTAVGAAAARWGSGAALGDEWIVGGRKANPRRQPEQAIDRHQAVRVATEARRI